MSKGKKDKWDLIGEITQMMEGMEIEVIRMIYITAKIWEGGKKKKDDK